MSAAPAVARKPAGREADSSTVHRLPPCHAVFPPDCWQKNASKLSHAQMAAILLTSELQGKAWLEMGREIPRDQVFVKVSPAQLATWAGMESRIMQKVVSDFVKSGCLRQEKTGAGKGCYYAPNWAEIAKLEPRAPRTLDRDNPKHKRRSPADFIPAKLDCPAGRECAIDALVMGPDGVLVNITPPRNVVSIEDSCQTYEPGFVGKQKAKMPKTGEDTAGGAGGAIPGEEGTGELTRKAMTDWLHAALPYEKMGGFLPVAIEGEIWKRVQTVPQWVWMDAIAARRPKIEKWGSSPRARWTLVLKIAVEAIQEWKHHGKPALRGATPDQRASQAEPARDPSICPGVGTRGCGKPKDPEASICPECIEYNRSLYKAKVRR